MEEAARRFSPANSGKFKKLLRGALRSRVDMPSGFSFCGLVPLLDPGPTRTGIQLRRMKGLPVPANDFASWIQLAEGMGKDRAIRFHGHRRHHSTVWIFATQDGRPHTYAKRRFDFRQRKVYHDYFIVDGAWRESGASANMMANAYRFYSAIGATRIEMTAGLSDGAAVWVRYGFQPANRAAWLSAKETIRANLSGLDKALRDAYKASWGHDLDEAVSIAIRGENPVAIFDLLKVDHGDRVANHCGLKHGIPGLLLKGGRWPAHLELHGDGGERLKEHLLKKGYVL